MDSNTNILGWKYDKLCVKMMFLKVRARVDNLILTEIPFVLLLPYYTRTVFFRQKLV